MSSSTPPIQPKNPSPLGAIARRNSAPSTISPATIDARIGAIQCFTDWKTTDSSAIRLSWIAYNIVAWRTAEFAVTNMRILREEGLIRRRNSTTLLSSLSDVRTNVGFVGGRLDYGDIVILTTSGSAGQDNFLCITKPLEFRKAVMEQKMAVDAPKTQLPPVAAAGTPPTAATLTAPAAQPASPFRPTSSDDAATLLRLAELRDKGAITDEEYATKKAEILARM